LEPLAFASSAIPQRSAKGMALPSAFMFFKTMFLEMPKCSITEKMLFLSFVFYHWNLFAICNL